MNNNEINCNDELCNNIHKNVDFTFNVKQDFQKIDDIIDDIGNNTQDKINITDYMDPKKIKKIHDDYIKQLQENKRKIETQTQGNKTIKKAEIIGGSRVNRKQEKLGSKEIEKEAKENNVNQKELMERVKKTIKSIEEEAEKIEKSSDFNKVYNFDNSQIKLAREFLFSTTLKQNYINKNGISTDKFISDVIDEKYTTSSQPKEVDSSPMQLVYITRLSKQLNTQLLQESDIRLSFNNVDVMILNYLKGIEKYDYYYVYILLREFFKKLIISSLSDIELAFRSQNNWINEEFKKLIIKDVVMLQSLPPKLAKSWKIFITELCDKNNVFNDLSKLDYVIHINDDFIIEETLAKVIKCMTPCFIYNYYLVVKSVYILCGLLDDWYHRTQTMITNVQNIDKNDLYNQLNDITKVCIYLYENSRHYENSTTRSLPYSTEPISQELQMYYLNHTIIGPQYKLLKGIEKYIFSLI